MKACSWMLAGFLAMSSCVADLASAPSAYACDEQYEARGVVVSFGPKRAFVDIAHERIAGYMGAMTMTFEARGPEQLAGIDVGSRVSFAFTTTDDGRRILVRIAKQ